MSAIALRLWYNQWPPYPVKSTLVFTVEVLRQLSILLDLLLNPDTHLTVKARNCLTVVTWSLFCQIGLVRLPFVRWRTKSLQAWIESGACSW